MSVLNDKNQSSITLTTTAIIDEHNIIYNVPKSQHSITVKQQHNNNNNDHITTTTNNNDNEQPSIKLLPNDLLIDNKTVESIHKKYKEIKNTKPIRYQVPYACLYIDSSWHDLYTAYTYGLTSGLNKLYHNHNKYEYTRKKCIQQINKLVQDRHNQCCINDQNNMLYNKTMYLLPTLSCRSALDLYLTAKQYNKGNIVLMSPINIPDVSHVIRAHGLIPLPIDIYDINTLHINIHELQSTIIRYGGKVCCLLIAHIYGKVIDLSHYIALCKLYNIDIIEDAAEAYSGYFYIGHPHSTVTFFSFGSIKINTSYGGAIVKLQDYSLYMKILAIHDTWSIQSNRSYIHKCVKNTAIMALLNISYVSGSTMKLSYITSFDHKSYVVSMLRGFPDKQQFINTIRQQPSYALLNMLYHRLYNFNSISYQSGNNKCDLLIELLSYNNIDKQQQQPQLCYTTPGLNVLKHNHWLFPLSLSIQYKAQEVIKQLNDLGVDAYMGATQLAAVDVPNELVNDTTNNNINNNNKHNHNNNSHNTTTINDIPIAKQFMSNVVYLPVHKHVPVKHIIRIAHVVSHVLQTLPSVNSSNCNTTILPSKL